jgi:ABC-2 type transport system permease protein
VLSRTVTQQNGQGPPSFEIVYPESAAFYMQNWFVFIILVAWIVVPLAIGYARFSRIDL